MIVVGVLGKGVQTVSNKCRVSVHNKYTTSPRKVSTKVYTRRGTPYVGEKMNYFTVTKTGESTTRTFACCTRSTLTLDAPNGLVRYDKSLDMITRVVLVIHGQGRGPRSYHTSVEEAAKKWLPTELAHLGATFWE